MACRAHDFALYEDDGISLGHSEGECAEVDIAMRTTDGDISIEVQKTGRYALPYRQVEVVLPSPESRKLLLRGEGVELMQSR